MNGHDRRSAFTKDMIKDAMLALLEREGFNEVSVSGLCREARVGRSTFYTHYTGLTDVLDELAEDAIQATAPSKAEGISGISALAKKLRETQDSREMESYMDLLPVCQRVADNPKYRVLFSDDFVSEYILMRIYRHVRTEMLPYMERSFSLREEEADSLFLFLITGAFAVNRAMGWKKDAAWYRVQRVLLTFQEGGYAALEKL